MIFQKYQNPLLDASDATFLKGAFAIKANRHAGLEAVTGGKSDQCGQILYAGGFI